MITQVKTHTQVAVAEFVTKLRADERLAQNVVVELMSYIFGDLASRPPAKVSPDRTF